MFDMTVPWWELVARAVIIYVALLVMMRISGKRTVGQFTPFDLLVVMLLSEAVSNGLSGGEESVGGGLLLALTLIALNISICICDLSQQQSHTIIEGEPKLIGRDGVIFKDSLYACRIPIADVEQALREYDCELEDMKCAFLEIDGAISILKQPKS